jgi:hypothetical protein
MISFLIKKKKKLDQDQIQKTGSGSNSKVPKMHRLPKHTYKFNALCSGFVHCHLTKGHDMDFHNNKSRS